MNRPKEEDIKDTWLFDKYPELLNILLLDHTTKKNIFWATENYRSLGNGFKYAEPILPDLITGSNMDILKPRVKKEQDLQQVRIREMAEVFTPSWICNIQNNLIDNAWFGYENIFNTEITLADGKNSWKVCHDKITFPEGKTWKDYVKESRLEMACGEAPYIISRYDATTGEFIPIERRIGLLDRKLRVINENVAKSGEWLKAVQLAYMSIYAFEWQGDNLLLARMEMLLTFIDNYKLKFGRNPIFRSMKYIAYIISWNVWQMDGLKGVIPNSCKETEIENLFGAIEKKQCYGCLKDNMKKHNGIYCLIKDWKSKNLETGKQGNIIRFVDLIK